MKFNFDKAKKSALKALKNPLLEAIVLGSSGAGKSFSIGTLGVKTLYLYGTRETHGPKSASVKGAANILPMCIDFGTWEDEKDERAFTADESLALIREILTSYEWMKKEGFKAIAFDGLAVLESLVKETTHWREKCKTAAGKHSNFKEVEASQEIIGSVISLLKAAQRELDLHIVVTGILDVKEVDGFGAIQEASPRLQGYGLAESLNQHFGDVIVIGKMTRGGETKYKFQFMTDLVKSSKDENGMQKRAMNFSPRLSGVPLDTVVMDADLSKLANIKREHMDKK